MLSNLVSDGKGRVTIPGRVDVVVVVVTVGNVVLGRDGSLLLMVVVLCNSLVVFVVGVDCITLAADLVVVAGLACSCLCGRSCSRSSV